MVREADDTLDYGPLLPLIALLLGLVGVAAIVMLVMHMPIGVDTDAARDRKFYISFALACTSIITATSLGLFFSTHRWFCQKTNPPLSKE